LFFKRERVYFGSWLPRFQSMVGWSHRFGPEVRLNVMVARMQRERERERERVQSRVESRYLLPGCPHQIMN
jgi:hypothetical protein